tara:strand:- start:74 stop:379 length:306 start_codon:yes stop_codon:yes gene_type:complete
MNTSGFYRNEDGQLLHGPTTVQFPISVDHPGLNRAQQDSYTYPVEGWYWFDSENEARAFFDMPLVEEPPDPLLVRARNPDGTYIGDDPSTPDIDEAWIPAP